VGNIIMHALAIRTRTLRRRMQRTPLLLQARRRTIMATTTCILHRLRVIMDTPITTGITVHLKMDLLLKEGSGI
jgi:hypothetical protein